MLPHAIEIKGDLAVLKKGHDKEKCHLVDVRMAHEDKLARLPYR